MILDNTTLIAAVASWLHRSDLAATIPDFIALAEARLNRTLRVKAMEATLASTPLVGGAASLPTGFLAFKELRYDGSTDYTLKPATLEWMRNQPATGLPTAFAVSGTQLLCDGLGNVTGTYYKAIPDLASYGTNWLITSAPDLYLYATLEEAGLYIADEERSKLWAARADFLREQLQSSDTANALSGGPLQMRIRK